jgi:spermidine/putrescine transport system ATP-binding protein
MKLELKQLQHRVGTTFIYITHDQGEAMTMSDQVAVMLRGRIEQIGAPDELYNGPATSFVAAFVGDSNRLSGQVVSRNEREAHVKVGPLEIKAVSKQDLEEGSDALLFVRPQNVLIRSQTEPIPEGYQTFPGLVKECIFEGATTHYIVELAEECQMEVVVPQASHIASFTVEERVQLAWNPEDTLCFSTEQMGDIDMSVGQE